LNNQICRRDLLLKILGSLDECHLDVHTMDVALLNGRLDNLVRYDSDQGYICFLTPICVLSALTAKHTWRCFLGMQHLRVDFVQIEYSYTGARSPLFDL
jgi:hypothetical protein